MSVHFCLVLHLQPEQEKYIYQQTDAVSMGGPASSTTAEIYMQGYERTATTTALHHPKVWERFFDEFILSLNVRISKTFPPYQQSSPKY